ncbi:homoserine O-succinyltransferase [Carboxylicivirga sp. M1479]|uniref:homoserine O-acetyltransferase MetA n=1 Tax=Carboxylicivirga sp. M1479 TaxID=2594476 RepID=UPI001178A095|nr:homoserine O-succinyltransferase [Carboxylicivirga sp. M1479]TRX62354.1 homoserine O-succinyltransferase [Carboxylicivirga sp. M1479]
MPIKIPDALPARHVLENENVFVIGEAKAMQQDIRPLKILILNLMPLKISTETHLLRALSNSPLQVEVDFLMTSSHVSKNTPREHLFAFYKVFEEVQANKYDGMIITGAPVELLEFNDVNYWSELSEIMDWSKMNVTSTFHICWGAQAGLYHHFGIKKYPLDKKMFGIFKHTVEKREEPLMRGFNDLYHAPHSRYTEVREEEILAHPDLVLLSKSEKAGVYMVMSKDRRQVFVTGHSEYDASTLKEEYDRDVAKGLDIEVPANYFPDDNPENDPMVLWRSHASLLYSNWLNYYVYQATPFELDKIT